MKYLNIYKGNNYFYASRELPAHPKQHGEDYYQKNLGALEKAIAIIEFKIRGWIVDLGVRFE